MDKKNELIQAMMDVEYCPPSELVRMNIDIEEAQKFPIEKAAALGVAFKPLTQLANYAAGGSGKSGIYFVNTAGKTMFQSGGQYIGNLQAANGGVGGGLARMTKVPFDPTMLCMAVAIMAVEKKLDAIHEAQKEILAFLEMKEEAKLKGNLNSLADVLNNYKFNWDNEKYKDHKHILVQDIKREAEQSIILYREQLTKSLKKNALFHSNHNVKVTLNKTMARLNDYHLALYTFSFSSFLEVMLLEKIPVISKSQLDENLIKAGGILQDVNTNRTQNVMQILVDSQIDYIGAFVENIQIIDSLYNRPVQLMFDADNIYIASI